VKHLTVLGMDPGFGDGVWAQMKAFLDGAQALGYEPELEYVAHPSLAGRPRDVPGTPVPLARVDSLNRLLAGRVLGPKLAGAGQLWVVSTTAPYGYPALRSGVPYTCWLSAGVAEESAGRMAGLSPSRRAASRVNAPLLRRLERAVIRSADAVYTISASSRAEVARAGGLAEETVGILPIPVDLDRFTPPAEERDLERPLLLFVGRADDPRKNLPLLLDAWPLVRRDVPGARLRLVGAPPATPVPEGVEVAGRVPSIVPHLQEAALLVLPSRQEGFGIAAAEALACGVPVVTTPSGGPERLVQESGAGVVLSGFGAVELAAAVVGLLRDVGTLSAMRRSGRGHVEREHSPARFRELLRPALDH
jgi:hypothetical protein